MTEFLEVSEQTVEEWRPGVTTRLIAAAANGARTLCAFEQHSQAGTGAPQHRHPHDEELIVVLEGTADFTVDGVVRRISEGTAVIVPPGAVHSFVNAGQHVLRTIAIFGSASPTVVYEDEPEVTMTIGSAGGHGVHRSRD
jgi:quercetin dioxygenase-like cupin family protein